MKGIIYRSISGRWAQVIYGIKNLKYVFQWIKMICIFGVCEKKNDPPAKIHIPDCRRVQVRKGGELT